MTEVKAMCDSMRVNRLAPTIQVGSRGPTMKHLLVFCPNGLCEAAVRANFSRLIAREVRF